MGSRPPLGSAKNALLSQHVAPTLLHHCQQLILLLGLELVKQRRDFKCDLLLTFILHIAVLFLMLFLHQIRWSSLSADLPYCSDTFPDARLQQWI